MIVDMYMMQELEYIDIKIKSINEIIFLMKKIIIHMVDMVAKVGKIMVMDMVLIR